MFDRVSFHSVIVINLIQFISKSILIMHSQTTLSHSIQSIRQIDFEIKCAKANIFDFNECVNQHNAFFSAPASQAIINEFVYDRNIYNCLSRTWAETRQVLSQKFGMYLPIYQDIGCRLESKLPEQFEDDSSFHCMLAFMEFLGNAMLGMKRLKVYHQTSYNTYFDLRPINCRDCRRRLGTVYFSHEAQKFMYEDCDDLNAIFKLEL